MRINKKSYRAGYILMLWAGLTFTIWFSRRDIMRKYDVYQQDHYVIVQDRNGGVIPLGIWIRMPR